MKSVLKTVSIVVLVLFFKQKIVAQEATTEIIQHPDIDKLLDYKKDTSTLKLYKIQVFQSVDPDKAQEEKANFLDLYSDWPVKIEWNTPNYKVWVGNFATRLEADRALKEIKKNYMNAIIFQPNTLRPKTKKEQ